MPFSNLLFTNAEHLAITPLSPISGEMCYSFAITKGTRSIHHHTVIALPSSNSQKVQVPLHKSNEIMFFGWRRIGNIFIYAFNRLVTSVITQPRGQSLYVITIEIINRHLQHVSYPDAKILNLNDVWKNWLLLLRNIWFTQIVL